MKRYRVTIVGATELVGQELVKVLYQRRFPLLELRLFASGRATQRKLLVGTREVAVKETRTTSFEDADVVFFTAHHEVSMRFSQYATQSGALVIDASQGYRLPNKKIPIIVPEVNGSTLHRRPKIIACPASVSAILSMVLYPLHQAATLKRVLVSTYQAVSDRGQAAMEELTEQVGRVGKGESAIPHVLPHQIAFNVLPETEVFLDSGYSREEWRVMQETRRLLEMPALPISITTAWVPTYVGHALSVHVQLEEALDRTTVQRLLAVMPGVQVHDDPGVSMYPHPWMSIGTDQVVVGRIREDMALENGLILWIASDNLRKGAALNAVQIAELAVERGWL
ncbi:MAG: aspartate-semialdehyde dehydrogenase [Chloroflexi bacterium]|nr:aspartate-semialdehyde dehydrogenase [Chloroflexota bacterium]MBU1747653.1 aspartate-semialdehyde dehydrogenase [Chloroflexota bacterium]